MAELLAVCTVDEVTWRGKTYHRGDVVRGMPSPGAEWGWCSKEELPVSGQEFPFVTSGRGTLSWLKDRPSPAPVVYGPYDLLHGTVEVDQAATLKASNAAFERDHQGRPVRSPEEEYKAHLRAMVANPIVDADTKLYCRRQLGEEPPLPMPSPEPAAPQAPAPVVEEVAAVDQTPAAPAADPGELEALLAEEALALEVGDQDGLAAAREQIAESLR